jgi:hypothetical protein
MKKKNEKDTTQEKINGEGPDEGKIALLGLRLAAGCQAGTPIVHHQFNPYNLPQLVIVYAQCNVKRHQQIKYTEVKTDNPHESARFKRPGLLEGILDFLQ